MHWLLNIIMMDTDIQIYPEFTISHHGNSIVTQGSKFPRI